ncbi:MAG TPA: hypothetical protein VGL59_03970 [Polyangia bacterium]|jgi:hypothetical protein
MSVIDGLCPVHGDAALDPNNAGGAPSCAACAQLSAGLDQLQSLARALPIRAPTALARDALRARIVAEAVVLISPPQSQTHSPTARRTTIVRWVGALGLCAGAAVAVVGLVARSHDPAPRASGEGFAPATAVVDSPATPAAPVLNRGEPVPAPTPTLAPSAVIAKSPVMVPRKRSPAAARRNAVPAEGHEVSPVIGAGESGAPPAEPVANAGTAPAPAPIATTVEHKLARDERSATGALANGGGQSPASAAAAGTATVRAAIVSAPANASPSGAAAGAAQPNDSTTADDRAADRAQRRQEMRERRREERIRRAERRR